MVVGVALPALPDVAVVADAAGVVAEPAVGVLPAADVVADGVVALVEAVVAAGLAAAAGVAAAGVAAGLALVAGVVAAPVPAVGVVAGSVPAAGVVAAVVGALAGVDEHAASIEMTAMPLIAAIAPRRVKRGPTCMHFSSVVKSVRSPVNLSGRMPARPPKSLYSVSTSTASIMPVASRRAASPPALTGGYSDGR